MKELLQHEERGLRSRSENSYLISQDCIELIGFRQASFGREVDQIKSNSIEKHCAIIETR